MATFPFRRDTTVALLVIVVLGLVTVLWPVEPAQPAGPRPRGYPATPARTAFERGLDTLIVRLDLLVGVVGGPQPAARAAFRAARVAYKRVECLLAVYGPAVVGLVDGPMPEESEDRPAGPLGAPAGFQILEASLFPGGDSPGRDSIHATASAMAASIREFRGFTPLLDINDAAVLDAMRLEVARVATIGVAGVDADLSGDAVVESAEALEGVALLARANLAMSPPAASPVRWAAIDSLARAGAASLRSQPRSETLNRLQFIVAHATPLARQLAVERAKLPPPLPLRRLWRQQAATPFEVGALDPQAYAPDIAPPPTGEVVALGRRLFYEPRLSGPGTRSCAFCHEESRAFTDGRARSSLLVPAAGVTRNTPTLLNAGYQPALFLDARAGSLEIQAGAVLASPSEMGGSAEQAAERLRADSSYRRAFASAFHGRPEREITERSVRVALAAYVRSLSGFNSRFDRAVRGDTLALSDAERHGFTVFMGKGRCGTCHFLPLFNGTMPPDFVLSEPEIIGTPTQPAVRPAHLDPDPGRGGFDHEATHLGAFKVPTLRNIALTAPYMHNGAFATLEQVVDFYDRGGGAGSGLKVPGQTLSLRHLNLARREKDDLVAFLQALTDTAVTPQVVATR